MGVTVERGVGRRGRREEEGEKEREDVEERTRNSLYSPVHWSTLHIYILPSLSSV